VKAVADFKIPEGENLRRICQICVLRAMHNVGFLPEWDAEGSDVAIWTRGRREPVWGWAAPGQPSYRQNVRRGIELLGRPKTERIVADIEGSCYQSKLALLSLFNRLELRASIEEIDVELERGQKAHNLLFLNRPVAIFTEMRKAGWFDVRSVDIDQRSRKLKATWTVESADDLRAMITEDAILGVSARGFGPTGDI